MHTSTHKCFHLSHSLVRMYQSVHNDSLEWSHVAARRVSPRWPFYPLASLLFVVVDLPWLWLNAGSVRTMIEDIQQEPFVFKVWAAVPVYVALAFLVSRANTRAEAFSLGLACYAVYDWTNLSTLSQYSWRFALTDSLWGGTLTCIVFSVLTHPRVAPVWGQSN